MTAESTENNAPAPTTTTTTKSPTTKGPRPARRFGTQSTTLEALNDSLGPLGPLGDNATPTIEEPPAPPQKERASTRGGRPISVKSGRSSLPGMMESVNLEEDGEDRDGRARIPPPVQPASNEGLRRQTQPSVSIEQAAKPSFDITVGDPHKVGDLTSSHTVYQVRTKVHYIEPGLGHEGHTDEPCRPHPKPTGLPSSMSPAVIETFSGSTTNYIATTPVLLFLHRQRSRLLVASIRTLSSQDVLL